MAYSTDFCDRHMGDSEQDAQTMLHAIGVDSLDALIDQTVPKAIRLQEPLNLPDALSEYDFLTHMRQLAAQNTVAKSWIGLGYSNTITPSVILRNIFENPGWYTQYTPYQAEISQGRLEALFVFQTMIADLTGMPVANASLLDEATAAAEAMTMLHRVRPASKQNANAFFVSEGCLPQTIAVLQSRAIPLGIELKIGNVTELGNTESIYGVLVQYPDQYGQISDFSALSNSLKSQDILLACAADLLSLVLLKSPGEWGADVVVGSAQRFGVPMGFGGPHAAFMATKEEFQRQLPGRIIGVSQDRRGQQAYRMALQTREQHIRREKATSNICTAQALLAIMAGMYAVYHGPDRLKAIAGRVHGLACQLAAALEEAGFRQLNIAFFDTLQIRVEPTQMQEIRDRALKAGVNFRYIDGVRIGITLDETTSEADLREIVEVFNLPRQASPATPSQKGNLSALGKNSREGAILTHPIFNTYHTETEMMRYLKRLENKDLALNRAMIPLGSCTMKLNAATEMMPVSWPEFGAIHPFVPSEQVQGYHQILTELETYLAEITHLPAVSLQPNSGSQGEFAGLLVIRAYHESRGDSHRNVVLIPSSAHGTNPASAAMIGAQIVIVKCDESGNVDLDDLRAKATQHKDDLSALMMTYPSTHGVFESAVKEICQIIHENGGQVYMDGANLNAQVGLTSPGAIGADVCHINLHKTFAIPHGGGGPGMGPICVAAHLAPFLPGHPVVKIGTEKSVPAVSAAPWGSASILLISYAYIHLLGGKGVRLATEKAILKANYIKSQLESYYPVLYVGENGRVAHELIIDCREFKKTTKIEVEDIAKRLIDYGFHAPTMSFPVPGTLMIEPTESESKSELDRFCQAMIAIRSEIAQVESGEADPIQNVLKNAPHCVAEVTADSWKFPYSRKAAAYPVDSLNQDKYWVNVARVDNAYGDRNLICTCPPVSEFEEVTSR